MEPQDTAELVNTAHHGFYDVAMDALGDGGIDEDSFLAFGQSDTNVSAKMMEAARAIVMTNDKAGLAELQASFYEQAETTTDLN